MHFFVQITVELPAELQDPDSPRRRELLAAELKRGLELRRGGTIVTIWRVPGALKNVGIWHADSEAQLRETISELPLGEWIAAEVTALEEHPIERELRKGPPDAG